MEELAQSQLFLWYVVAMGGCIGSFLNVVIARVPLGESVVSPRSKCPKCNNSIAWYDNIPVLSWLVLLARCRQCKTPISARYPLIEVLMAILAGALWMKMGPTWEFVIWLPLSAALVAVSFIDIDHWLIPDVIVFPFILFVGAAVFLPGGVTPLDACLGLLPAALIFSVGWGFEKMTGREGLGFGDVKLLALLGIAVGLLPALNILLLSSIQGAIIGIALRLFTSGHEAQKSGGGASPDPTESLNDGVEQNDSEEDWVPPPYAIPFGPFLALAGLQVILLPPELSDISYYISQFLVEGPL